ncbi:MAG: PEGA domain-containing protein [Lentisphaeria bacterium]|jgi:hypothetical protein
MKLRILNGKNQGKIVEVSKDPFIIGREGDNDLVLVMEGISRKHAQITRVDGSFLIADLGSTNGIRINGQAVAGKVELKPDDRIGIGEAILLVMEPEQPAMPPPAGLPAPLPPLPPRRRGGPGRGGMMGLALLALALVGIGIAGYWLFLKPPPPAPASTPIAPPPAATTPTPPPAPGLPGLPPLPAAPPPVKAAPTPEPVPVAAVEPPSPPATMAAPARPMPLLLQTEPAGALAKLDGKELGRTPVAIPEAAPGRHLLTFALEGYEELARQIHVPDLLPDKPYTLRQAAGTLRISSTPAGATVYWGPRILGQTPLMLTTLPPDTHSFDLVLEGYDRATVKAIVSPLQPATLDVPLASRLGTLEITTFPPGLDITVNSHKVGATLPVTVLESKAIILDGLPEGKYKVVAAHPAGLRELRQPEVARGKITKVLFRLWVPNTEVLLTDHSRRYGMLLEINDSGDVALQESPSPTSTARILKPQIESVNLLPTSKIRELLSRAEQERLATEAQAAEATAAQAAEAKLPEVPLLPETVPVTAETAINWLKDSPAPQATRLRHLGRRLIIVGVPVNWSFDRGSAEVILDKLGRCTFDRRAFDAFSDTATLARIRNRPVAISGTIKDFSETGIHLADCRHEPALAPSPIQP